MSMRLEYFDVEDTSGGGLSPLAPLSLQFLLAGGGILLSLSFSLALLGRGFSTLVSGIFSFAVLVSPLC
jgi:hypothetical protein